MNKSYLKLFSTAALFFTVGIQAMVPRSVVYDLNGRMGYLERRQENLDRCMWNLTESQNNETFNFVRYREYFEQTQKKMAFDFATLKKEIDALKRKQVQGFGGKIDKKGSPKSKIGQNDKKTPNKKTYLPEKLIDGSCDESNIPSNIIRGEE